MRRFFFINHYRILDIQLHEMYTGIIKVALISVHFTLDYANSLPSRSGSGSGEPSMRLSKSLMVLLPLFAIVVFSGCFKRAPANVYPGSDDYNKRVANFKITPEQAYRIAHEAAQTDRQLHFISRTPTVVAKRWYVFSVPLPSGANLQGYHVNGDNGDVKFVNEKKVIPHTAR